jgi:hypothetical protein
MWCFWLVVALVCVLAIAMLFLGICWCHRNPPTARVAVMPPSLSSSEDFNWMVVVFTDIENFTLLQNSLHEDIINTVLQVHDKSLEQLVLQHGGRILKHLGDGCLCTFLDVQDAMCMAADLQRTLQRCDWPQKFFVVATTTQHSPATHALAGHPGTGSVSVRAGTAELG